MTRSALLEPNGETQRRLKLTLAYLVPSRPLIEPLVATAAPPSTLASFESRDRLPAVSMPPVYGDFLDLKYHCTARKWTGPNAIEAYFIEWDAVGQPGAVGARRGGLWGEMGPKWPPRPLT